MIWGVALALTVAIDIAVLSDDTGGGTILIGAPLFCLYYFVKSIRTQMSENRR